MDLWDGLKMKSWMSSISNSTLRGWGESGTGQEVEFMYRYVGGNEELVVDLV